MRIFSKKAFSIGEGLKRGTDVIENFITVPNAFQEMPDKYANDPTFLLAKKAGDITVISGREDERAAEDDESVINDKSAMTETQAFYEELKVMHKDDAMKLGEKYDVKPANDEKLGQYKKRIMEAYKLANSDSSEAQGSAEDNEGQGSTGDNEGAEG